MGCGCHESRRSDASLRASLVPAVTLAIPASVLADVDAARGASLAGDLVTSAALWRRALETWRLIINRVPRGPYRQASLNQWRVWFAEVARLDAQIARDHG